MKKPAATERPKIILMILKILIAALGSYFTAWGLTEMAGDLPLTAKQALLFPIAGLFLLVNIRFFRRPGKKKTTVPEWLLAVLFLFFFLMGYAQEKTGNRAFTPLPDQPRLKYIFYAALLWNTVLLISELNRFLDRLPGRPKIRHNQTLRQASSAKWAWLLPAVLLLGWLPHLICNFPGSVCYDSRDQLEMALGYRTLTNQNPVLDTWIYGGLYQLGRNLFGTGNAGIAAITITQLILMSLSFSFLIWEGYRLLSAKGLKKPGLIFVILSAAFYILVPIFGGCVQVVMKDSLHLPFFFLMTALQLHLFRNPDRRWNKICYAAALILVSLTRAMAFYYAAADAAGTVLFFAKRHRNSVRDIAVAAGAAILAVLLWDHVILPASQIKSYPSVEKYATPIQQVAFTALKNENRLTDREQETIRSVMDPETMKKKYDPNLADPLKNIFDDTHMGAFRELYFSWLLKYPQDMLKGFMTGHYMYLYPLSNGYENYRAYIAPDPKFGGSLHYTDKTAKEAMKSYVRDIWEKNPFLSLFMGPGLYSWILLFTVMRCIRNRKRTEMTVLLPLIVLFIGLLFTPRNGESRYAYPLIASAPLLVLFCTGSKNDSLLS